MADYTLSAKITGDSSGFSKAFDSAQSKLADISKNISGAGKKVKDFGGQMTSVGSNLSSKITTPAVAATSALLGVTLVKGFGRLAGIDTARAKMQGLGHDGVAVDAIMANALDSVRGTSFGMDEAATTAANAVAAGIPPGKELTRYLTLTGDAAAIAGSSMSEMGSIVNKVTTAGKAYNGELQQLSDRGLPIYSWIAKEAGIAEDAVFDFASSGKVSSEMLLNAVENNIGGAAKVMGETSFTAAVANIGAAVGRIGANFLDAGGKGGGFFSTVKPLLTEFIGVIDNMAPIAEELGVKFGNAFNNAIEGVKQVKSWFDNLSPSVQSLTLKAAGIAAAFAIGIGPALVYGGKLVSLFGTLMTAVGFLVSPIGLLLTAITVLAGGFAFLMATNEGFRNSMATIGQTIATVGQIVWAFFTNFQKLGGLNETLHNILPEDVANRIWSGLMNILHPINSMIIAIKTMGQIVTGSIGNLLELDTALGGVFGDKGFGRIVTFMHFVNDLKLAISGIKDVVTGQASSFQDLDNVFMGVFSEKQTNLILNIGNTIRTVFETGKSIISGFATFVSQNFGTVVTFLAGAFSQVGPQISSVFQTIWGIVQAVLPLITTFFSSLLSGFQSADGAGSGFGINLTTILFGLNPVIKGIILLFQNFGPQIVAAFQMVASMLLPVIATIGTTIGQLASTIIPILMTAFATLVPIIMQVGTTFMNIISAVLPVLISLFNQFVPIIAQVVMIFAGIIAQVIPLVGVFIGALLPVIQSVIQTFMNIVTSVAPAFIAIVQLIVTAIQGMAPIFMYMLSIAVQVFANIMSTISPIVAFIGGVIVAIMSVITPIIVFVAGVIGSIIAVITPIISVVTGVFSTVFTVVSGVFRNIMNFIGVAINAISTIISSLTGIVSGIFNSIYGTVSRVMGNVSSKITGVFESIKGAWTGLTTFVDGIFDGISGSIQTLVNQIKGFVNGVIRGINSSLDVINLIPGVNIGKLPQLARGTDDFQGGFARINEGGRGELVHMPGGTQVIPHDVSMRYAREAGKQSAAQSSNNRVSQQAVADGRKQPAYIQLDLGRRVLRGFTEDITDIQNANVQLEENYR